MFKAGRSSVPDQVHVIDYINDITAITKRYNELAERFSQKFLSSVGMTYKKELLDDFSLRVNEMSTYAADYDFQGIPSNGYRSLLRTWMRLFEVAAKYKHTDDVNNFLIILERMHRWQITCDEIRKHSLSDNYNPEVGRRHISSMFVDGDQISMRIFMSDSLVGINFPASMQLIVRSMVYAASVSVAYSMPLTSMARVVKSVLKFNDAAFNFAHFMINIEPHMMASLIRQLDHGAASFGNKLMRIVTFKKSCESRTKSIVANSHFLIDIDSVGVHLRKRVIPTQSNLNMRILKHGNSQEFANKVVIYLHGGAFFGPSAQAVEDVYVKDWMTSLKGLTMINFDYSLSPEHRFPTALQEVLDLYLWVISGEKSVREALGFSPVEIVVSGDSSGGNLAAALMLLLNDIRRLHFDSVGVDEPMERIPDVVTCTTTSLSSQLKEFMMPSTCLLFFPKLQLRMEVLPSTFLTNLDAIVNQWVQLRVCQSYLPLIERNRLNGDWSLVHHSASRDKLPKDWIFNPDFATLSSPYLTPYSYENFESLSDVQLHVLAFNFDPLLDEALMLLRKWKGKCHFEVLDHVCHGCFAMNGFNKDAAEAVTTAAKMIGNAFIKK
jgi:acetyl esterase/lipase